MCGITGFFEKNTIIKDTSIIKDMIRLIKHRGPDDNGFEITPTFEYQNVAMGFVRLSILDLSIRGHQPMYNDERNICITFNGEIYNAFSFKKKLEEKGYVFKTKTDTEVLLYLYQEYGIDGMLKKINGMFAIAISDMRLRKFFLVRDRVGVKPLYYYSDENVFLYSSEIKAFYAHDKYKNELNDKKIKEYCMFRYVAGKETLLRNVFNVLPAHYIEVSEGMKIETKKYWDLPKEGTELPLKTSDWEDQIVRVVSERLLSDAPIGVQLSGGIDSSLIAYFAKKHSDDKLSSYSITFDNEDISEKKYIDIAANVIGIKNQHQYICDTDTFCRLFHESTWNLDLPLNHPNSVGIMQMCYGARDDKVKVLLSGEGADELFGGYGRYVRFFWSQQHPVLRKREDIEKGIKRYWNSREEEFIASSAFLKPEGLLRILKDKDIKDILESRFLLYSECPGKDKSIEKFLNYELRTYLVDILNRQDKMSMAASIETRVPFLDYKLIETVRRQIPNTYIKGDKTKLEKNSKLPLKKISRKIFGDEFTFRAKCGFGMPLNEYFNENNISAYVREELLPIINDFGIFDMDIINTHWNKRGVLSYYEFESSLWIVIALAQWSKMFLGDKRKVLDYK